MAIGRKCVTRNEEFFCGHFPGQPVMPGVLILEALARPGPWPPSACPKTRASWPCSAASKMPLPQAGHPRDVLTLHCELVEQRGPVGVGKASAYVDGKCAATAELTFVLTEAQ